MLDQYDLAGVEPDKSLQETDMISQSGESATEASQLTVLSQDELVELFFIKYGDPALAGWGPKMRWSYRYFTPSDHYEALVSRLVKPSTQWLDIGCGRSLFSSTRVAEELSNRCRLLVGVDPDETLDENPYVHKKVRCSITDFHSDGQFDLVTMNMVAEHIADPVALVAVLSKLVREGGRIVVHTVYRFSPVPLITRLVPFHLHHIAKRLLWGTEERDTFPVVYKMNTRQNLRDYFVTAGFREAYFAYVDDCRTTQNFRLLQHVELGIRGALHHFSLPYPEVCIIAVYQRAELSSHP